MPGNCCLYHSLPTMNTSICIGVPRAAATLMMEAHLLCLPKPSPHHMPAKPCSKCHCLDDIKGVATYLLSTLNTGNSRVAGFTVQHSLPFRTACSCSSSPLSCRLQAPTIEQSIVPPAGPALLQDIQTVERLMDLNREPIPQRLVHPRGTVAKGFFEASPLTMHQPVMMLHAPCNTNTCMRRSRRTSRASPLQTCSLASASAQMSLCASQQSPVPPVLPSGSVTREALQSRCTRARETGTCSACRRPCGPPCCTHESCT